MKAEAGDEIYHSLREWSIDFLKADRGLGKLRPHILDFTKADLDRHETIAMSCKLSCLRHSVLVDRPVRNLDEAVLAGSEAASLWQEARTAQDVHQKLMKTKNCYK